MNPSLHRGPRGERGVALVITLIMLGVMATIAIIFLALVNRESQSMSGAADLADAENAAEAGRTRAIAEVLAGMMARNDLMAFDLTVSRATFDALDQLYRDPSGPVFVNTNRSGGNGPLDNRFYLDLNRTALFEANTNGVVGDPEWIYILEKLGEPHGARNRFIGRYAFLVVPVGKALDLNWIHNEAGSQAQFNYQRNQGVGSWELNLAAFLNELNPTVWTYNYGPLPAPASSGTAFADAQSLLNYRYAGSPANLASFTSLFVSNSVWNPFRYDLVDAAADDVQAVGALSFGDAAALLVLDNDDPSKPWVGADNPRHFFHSQEIFDPLKVSSPFIQNLNNATAADPYTFYKLVGQLATDSAPVAGKLHLNYANLPPFSETNFMAWTDSPDLKLMFFTNAAERIFQRQFYDFNPLANRGVNSVTNIASMFRIPVTNYSPAIHRILQVAANILDATSTNEFPSVFRPLFTVQNNVAFVSGYTNDDQLATYRAWLNDNPYGIPMIVGAKKGFPNFNELTFRMDVQVERKVELVRPSTNAMLGTPGWKTNQMYLLGVSNMIAVELWNSYGRVYPRPLQVEIGNYMQITITNHLGLLYRQYFGDGIITNLSASALLPYQLSVPLFAQRVVMTNAVYRFADNSLQPIGQDRFESFKNDLPLPTGTITVSNRFVCVIADGPRIVDFVVFNDGVPAFNVHDELNGPKGLAGVASMSAQGRQVWNAAGGTNAAPGVSAQIQISLGNPTLGDDEWANFNSPQGVPLSTRDYAIANLRAFCQYPMGPFSSYSPSLLNGANKLNMQLPFTPIAKMLKTYTYQVNDPLVHTLMDDLIILPGNTNNSETTLVAPPTLPIQTNYGLSTIGLTNVNHRPWGGNLEKDPANDLKRFDIALKDPGMWRSDFWSFPAGTFPSIGWLGRVHRGTPWQTIYLKSEVADLYRWGWLSRDVRTHPTNDWKLVDVFTTALYDNASRGLLSVNQTNRASWAAVLAGVVVLTNSLPDTALTTKSYPQLAATLIAPNDTNFTIIVDALHGYRMSHTNGLFGSVGEILAVPQLTTLSPYVASGYRDARWDAQLQSGLTDEAFERIPQQILSLLKVGDPRFLVYAYGQSLKPAKDSVATSGPLTGMVTNYVVTGEMATRTLIKVEGSPDQPRAVVEGFNILPPD